MQVSFRQLLHIHQLIDPIDDVIALCQRSCELLAQALQLPDQVLYLSNSKQQLQQVAAAGAKFAPGNGVLSPLQLSYGEGVVGQAAQLGQSLCIADTRAVPGYICDDARRPAELSVPIVYQGEILGVLDAEHIEAGFFGPVQQQFTEALAALLGPRLANLAARHRLAKRQHVSGYSKPAVTLVQNWLPQQQFNSTLLQALKHFYCDKRWQSLPLEQIALVQQRGAESALQQAQLRRSLTEGIMAMRSQAATALWGNILHARYIDKQDQLTLADQHYMAFSTLRRHQQLAQQHLLHLLWQAELQHR